MLLIDPCSYHFVANLKENNLGITEFDRNLGI